MEGVLDITKQKFLKRKDSVPFPTGLSAEGFAQLISVLAIEPESRSRNQLSLLATFSRHLKFFSELRESLSDSAHYHCCRCLKHASYPAGSFVFKEGADGSQFFIVLAGSCGVIQSDSKQRKKLLQILRAGDCFGELALISNGKRAASILCREDCHFAVLEREDYKEILGTIQTKSIQEKMEAVRRYAVFAQFTEDGITQLAYILKTRTLKAGQDLFLAGQTVNEVFLVKSGTFRLYKRVQSGSKGQRTEVTIGRVQTGELLGSLEALEDDAFDFSCSCESETGEVLLIAKAKFKAILTDEKKVNALLLHERGRIQAFSSSVPHQIDIKRFEKRPIPTISESAYERLTLKHPSKWQLPIIYKPKVFVVSKKSSLPELDRKALHLSLLSSTDLDRSCDSFAPVTITSKQVKRPLRPKKSIFYYGAKPRFVGESLLANSLLARSEMEF
jgi:CRP-like cAMP-binding protein